MTELTRRETEILTLLIAGHRHRTIGAQLHISPRTVEAHARNIRRKLQVRSVAALVRTALDRRLVALPPVIRRH